MIFLKTASQKSKGKTLCGPSNKKYRNKKLSTATKLKIDPSIRLHIHD